MDNNARTWAMLLHLSLLSGFLVPLGGYIVPVLIWQLKKEEIPEIDAHGKMAVNFILSMLIYGLISTVLVFLLVGIVLLAALGVIGIVFPIIAGIKANAGEFWRYPLTLELIK